MVVVVKDLGNEGWLVLFSLSYNFAVLVTKVGWCCFLSLIISQVFFPFFCLSLCVSVSVSVSLSHFQVGNHQKISQRLQIQIQVSRRQYLSDEKLV